MKFSKETFFSSKKSDLCANSSILCEQKKQMRVTGRWWRDAKKPTSRRALKRFTRMYGKMQVQVISQLSIFLSFPHCSFLALHQFVLAVFFGLIMIMVWLWSVTGKTFLVLGYYCMSDVAKRIVRHAKQQDNSVRKRVYLTYQLHNKLHTIIIWIKSRFLMRRVIFHFVATIGVIAYPKLKCIVCWFNALDILPFSAIFF